MSLSKTNGADTTVETESSGFPLLSYISERVICNDCISEPVPLTAILIAYLVSVTISKFCGKLEISVAEPVPVRSKLKLLVVIELETVADPYTFSLNVISRVSELVKVNKSTFGPKRSLSTAVFDA